MLTKILWQDQASSTFKAIYSSRLVHKSEFRDEVEEYSFPNTTYPWEFYRGSFAELGDKSYHKNRVLLSEEHDLDDSFFDSNFGNLLNEI